MMSARRWFLLLGPVLGVLLAVLLAACSSTLQPDERAAVARISQYEDIAGVAYAASFRLMRMEQPHDDRYTLFYSYEVRAADDYQHAVLKLASTIDADSEDYYPARLRGQIGPFMLRKGVVLAADKLPAAFQDYLHAASTTPYRERLEHLQLAMYAAQAYGFLPDTEKGEMLEERNIRIYFRHTQVYGWVSGLG
ncbi:hypothetical protein [Vogesella sp. LIG4]|uniref:hypothetical protein n=1 Tax=Vogesella sp. LIG4 TaxID=1192162 RepID=UPI00081FFB89|nr:hypothetical protein [Vogesella sp. LIG4]SCK17678.1 hypothetical protein PSELUDRAFT_1880 [Vogesella sp. LIG4]